MALRPVLVLLVALLFGSGLLALAQSGSWPSTAALSGSPLRGVVTHVRDGDTLELSGRVVRLQGVAAPELHEAFGREAKDALERLVLGRTLDCIPDGSRSYGRIVAVCRLSGEDVGARMVASGFARDCPRFSAGRYAALEREAERRGSPLRRRYELPAYCLPWP